MADNIQLNLGTGGDVLAAKEVSSVKYQRIVDYETELGTSGGATSLRDRLVAQRYTVLSDSLADGLASFWSSTTANGGTATSSGGEGLVQTSAAATGSAQLTSGVVAYYPGQVSWFNSAVRFNDTGTAGNTRRIGAFTVSALAPQNGAYYELTSSGLSAVVVNAGTPSATAVASWSEVAIAPFTLDTNYHSLELRFTANTVLFYVDNVLRHRASGTSAAITATLNFPITIQSINTSGATNRLIAVRNCGLGRFGEPEEQEAIALGANPTAIQAGQKSKAYTNRHGIPFVIGGHPNTISYAHTAITTAVTDSALITISTGSKIVVTRLTATLDNASTVFPTVRIGFGSANVPALGNAGIIVAHGGVPAGGGFNVGDGSGIVGIGADGEDLRITTTGNATGNGLQISVSYHTVDS
jgi:hypothetical protein